VDKMDIIGSVISGKHGDIIIRQKSGSTVELGDLLIVTYEQTSLLLQVYDIKYGSQIPLQHLELVSGMRLEGYAAELDFIDPNLRNYGIIQVKAIAQINTRILESRKCFRPLWARCATS